MSTGYHPYTWLLWLAAGGAVALLTRNPFYLAILIVAAGFVFWTLARRQQGKGAASAAQNRSGTWAPVLKLALFLVVFTVLFNTLTAHQGRHVIVALPRAWPMIGGPITLESVIFGLVTGMSFFALMLVFSTFNSAVGPQTLLRLVPAFAHHAGVALTIAVSFIPQTVVAWQGIREAQRLRGYKVRGLRDLQPLFVSLLGIGLDRAIQLAESMDARGFGGTSQPLAGRERSLVGAGTVIGLLLLLAGLLARSFGLGHDGLALLLLGVGGLSLVVTFRRQGRQMQRSYYRRWLWRRRDTIVVAIISLTLLVSLALSVLAPKALFYYPYPPYSLLPEFDPMLGLLFVLLLIPALLLPASARPIKKRNPASTKRTSEPLQEASKQPGLP